MILELVAHIAVEADIVEEIMALENTVMLHDPVILFRQEGFQDRRRDIGEVEVAERVADVVEQRHHHIFLVPPVAMRTQRRLHAIRAPVARTAAKMALEKLNVTPGSPPVGKRWVSTCKTRV